MIKIEEPSGNQLIMVRATIESAKTILFELIAHADGEARAKYQAVADLLFAATDRLNAMVVAGDIHEPGTPPQ